MAHVGAVVSVANFTTPPAPTSNAADAGRIVAPFTFATADQSYTVSWMDGDVDPTGRFVFWWMDHHPTFAVGVDQIESSGIATKIGDAINQAGGYWVSCYCSPDAGVTCPTDPRSATGNCANSFTWDTSMLPAGAYWIVAVNTDPPFHVYNAALSPVIVAHGGTAPPAAIFVRPDGYGAYDKSFRAQWLATGKTPLTFSFSYGIDAYANVLDAPTPIAGPIKPFTNSDGTLGFDWDVSQLMNNTTYYLRVKVTDGDGNSTFTDSHYGLQIFRTSGGGGGGGGSMATPDLSMVQTHKKSGCSFVAGGSDGSGAPAAFLMLAVAGYFFARRRSG